MDGTRTLTDAREMRALAHPVRVALLEALTREGQLTATEAGEQLRETPANCSFHLRTLAKYGFVEEAEGGTGRQRPWRRVGGLLDFELDNEETDATIAAHELSRRFEDRSRQRREVWEAARSSFPVAWRKASFTMNTLSYLTVEELAAMNAEICAIVDRYRERVTDRAERPADAYPVALSATGHPLPRTPSGN